MSRFLACILMLTSLIFVAPASFAKGTKHKHHKRGTTYLLSLEDFKTLTPRNKVAYIIEVRKTMIKAETAQNRMQGKKTAFQFPAFLMDDLQAADSSCLVAGNLVPGDPTKACSSLSLRQGYECKKQGDVPCNEMFFGSHNDSSVFCVSAAKGDASAPESWPINNAVKNCLRASDDYFKGKKTSYEEWLTANIKRIGTKRYNDYLAGVNKACRAEKAKEEWMQGACRDLLKRTQDYQWVVDQAANEEGEVASTSNEEMIKASQVPTFKSSVEEKITTYTACESGEEPVPNPLLGAGAEQFCQAHVDEKSGSEFPVGYYVVTASRDIETGYNQYNKLKVYRAISPNGPFCTLKDQGDKEENRVLKTGDPKNQCKTPEFAFMGKSDMTGNFKLKIGLHRNDSNLCDFSLMEDKKFKIIPRNKDIKTTAYVFGHEDENTIGNRAELVRIVGREVKCPSATTRSLTDSLASLMSNKECFPKGGMPTLRAANHGAKDFEKKMKYSSSRIEIDSDLDGTKAGRASLCTSATECVFIDWAEGGAKTVADWDNLTVKANGDDTLLGTACPFKVNLTASQALPNAGTPAGGQ